MAQYHSAHMQNALLANLSPHEWDHLEPYMHSADLAAQDTLHRSHEPIEHAYFPLSGSVSLLVELSDGFSAEVMQIGNEGMVGSPLVLNHIESVTVARVQVAGTALRIAAEKLVEQFDRLASLRRSLLRHIGVQLAQGMQLAACNAHHSLEARLARCLLGLHDRVANQPIALTHESLAALLCAHRPSISVSLKRLQQRGLIRQQMGSLVVVDRAGLEQACCECYAVVHGPGNTQDQQLRQGLQN